MNRVWMAPLAGRGAARVTHIRNEACVACGTGDG